MLIIKFIFASYRASWSKLFLVILALCGGSAGMTAVLLINSSAQNSMSKVDFALAGSAKYSITKEHSNLSKQDYATMRRAGIQAMPLLADTLVTQQGTELALIGIDLFAIPSQAGNSPKNADNDITAFASTEVWISEQAVFLDEIDSQGVLALNNGGQLQRIATTKLVKDPNTAVLDLNLALQLSNRADLDSVLVYSELTQAQRKWLTGLGMKINPNLVPETNLSSSFQQNLLAMALLMFIVCLFVAVNAINLLLADRSRNINIMRQLGVSEQELVRWLAVEALVMAIMSGVAGFALGYSLTQFLLPAVERTFASLFFLKFDLKSSVDIASLAIGSSLLGAAVACALAYQRFRQIQANPNRSELAAKPSGLPTMGAMAVATTLGFALAYLLPIQHMLWQYLVIALLLLAGCLMLLWLLPKWVDALATRLPRRYPVWRFTFFDSSRLMQRSSLAFCAFFIAISANIGMNMMVDSFRQATTQWIDFQFKADYYITTTDVDLLKLSVSELSPTAQLFQRHYLKYPFVDGNIELVSFSPEAYQYITLQFKHSVKHPYQDIVADGVFINEQLANKHRLAVGDELSLAGSHWPVVAIYYDYGNMLAQAHVPQGLFFTLQPEPRSFQRFAFTTSGKDGTQATQQEVDRLFANWDSNDKIRYFSLAQIKQLSVDTFDRTFAVTNGLGIITLLVAAFSLATSVSLLERESSQKQGLLNVLGVTGAIQFVINLCQYCLLIGLLFLLALPFGFALCWLLVNRINLYAFHWSFPLQIATTPLFTLMATSALTCIAAVSIMLVRRNRTNLNRQLAGD